MKQEPSVTNIYALKVLIEINYQLVVLLLSIVDINTDQMENYSKNNLQEKQSSLVLIITMEV